MRLKGERRRVLGGSGVEATLAELRISVRITPICAWKPLREGLLRKENIAIAAAVAKKGYSCRFWNGKYECAGRTKKGKHLGNTTEHGYVIWY